MQSNHPATPILASNITSNIGNPRPQAADPSFELAVKKYHARIFQLVYRYLGDYDEADDLTQETFVRAYRAWGSFRGDSEVYTWLYRIALNLCHNQRKKLQKLHRIENTLLNAFPKSSMEEQTYLSKDVPDNTAMPWLDLERKELNQQLYTALQTLPENYRTVILLRDIEGLSYEEIAAMISCSLQTVKSRLFRARNLLRQRLSIYITGNK